MIDICHLSKSYGGKAVLEDISFSVPDGCIYGLVGYNGAGKTTLLSLIAGLLRPDAGTVTADVGVGATAHRYSTFDSATVHREMFFIQDDPYILPAADLQGMAAFYRGYFPRFSMDTFHKLTSLFGLDEKKRISGFSKGMKRQAALVLGLSARPRYLLLDESFDGLDPGIRRTVCDLLMEYMADTGSTVIMASHNLGAIEHVCDTVGMLNGNRIVYSCDVEDLRNRYRSMRAAFSAEADATLLADLRHGELVVSGRVMTFVTEEDEETVKHALSKSGTLCLLESQGLTLEEIFTYENRKGGVHHDIAGLFGGEND